jgi:hypothetical protein
MKVIHFTAGAGDALWGHGNRKVGFVPLLQTGAGAHVGCIHLEKNSHWPEQCFENECALLVIQGKAVVWTHCRLDMSAGVGIAFEPHERFSVDSEEGAILLLMECKGLEATEVAISTPARIMGQKWPGE